MNNGIGEDCDELEAGSDDGVRSPNGPASSGYFRWNKFSGVVHHIVNKFSRVVPKTVSPAPPMTAAEGSHRSQAHAEDGNQDQSCEMRDRNDAQPSPYQMNLHGLGADGGRVDRVTGGQSDVGAGVGSTRFYPQFRKESSNFNTKNASDTIIHSPSYSSPSSGPVGQMPVVHLSPRHRPLLLRNEDRAKPVMVKIAQQDPLRSTLMIRHRSSENISENNSSTVDPSALTETVVDALKKKRKRHHLDRDENEVHDHEGNDQLSKKRCSRDDEAAAAAETAMSRGMKRRALHDAFDDEDDIADQSEDVVEGAAKKVCQNSSPSPQRSGCGVRDVISASYSSHLRWEERINRAKSRSQSRAASSQDESMPLVEDGGPSSSWASRCSSHVSRLSRPNSPVPRDEGLRRGIRSTHSLQSSDRSTPLNLLHRLNDLDSAQRAPLLVRDGSVKNRVTMLSGVSTPLPDLESRLMDSSEMKAPVEFTADDLERDRDLLNSRASRLLLGFMEADDETDGVVEPASTTTMPVPTTGGFTLGQASSTTFQTSGVIPASATVTAGPTDHTVQTSTGSAITGANVLNSKIDGAVSTPAVSQNPFVSTMKQDDGGFSGSTAANADFKFGSSAGVVYPATNPAISTATVSSTGTITTTHDSSGSQAKPSAQPESGLKGFGAGASSFGAFSVPSSGASDQGKPGSASGLNGPSFAPGALTTAAGSTTVAPSAFGTMSNVVSFGNVSNSIPKAATSLAGAFPTSGDTRAASNFFGGASAVGNSAVAATNAATATKDNAQMTTGGFAFGKPGGTQATADNLGNAKPLVVAAQTTAGGPSFGNSITAPATAGSFSFGNSGTTQTTANSFSFPNSSASQTAASNFAFGGSANTQTTASSSAFGNVGATQTTAGNFSFGTTHTPASNISFGNSGTLPMTTSSFATGTSQATANSFSFGNSGDAPAPASSLAFGNQGGKQTTASSFSFGNSGNTQATANSLTFGNSGSTQTTANNLSFGNSGVAQLAVGGFGFGNASTNPTTGNNMSGSVPTAVNSFGFGNSSGNPMAAGAFGNSGNVQTTANSSFAAVGAAPQFSFGKSPAPGAANPSTAGGFGFGNVQQHQANSGNNPTTANPFGNSMPTANAFGSSSAAPSTFGSSVATINTFGSNAAAPNAFGNSATTGNTFGRSSAASSTFGSNMTTANSFGSNAPAPNAFGNSATTANTFGSNAATANIFGGISTTANTFGSTQPPSNPFSSTAKTANPFGGSLATANLFGTTTNNNFDNKSSALQFNRPDVAATNQSTPQDLRRVLFPSTPGNNNNSMLGSNMQATQSQQQSAFNFFGTKTDGNSNSTNSPGGFAFGKNSASAPTFGSNSTAGGFPFGKTAVGSTQAQPANPSFSFQGATGTNSQMPNMGAGFGTVAQQGVNSQAPNTAFNFQPMANPSQAPNAPFNFSASATNFSFGQMSIPPASNGLPSIASFGAGPKFTPGTTYGPTTTSSRSSLRKKKGR